MWTPEPGQIVTSEMKAEAGAADAMAVYEDAIQLHVDAKPRERNFRDGVTLASYAASTNALWQAQALAFIAWRDAVWMYAYGELAKVLAGERPQPTVDDFIAELPALTWPI